MGKKNWLIALLIFLLIFFVFFKPNTITNYDTFNTVCNAIVSLITVFATIVFIKSPKKYPFSIIVLIYLIVLFIATLINGNNITFFFKTYLVLWGIMLLTENAIHNDYKKYFYFFNCFVTIMLIINIITLLFPNTFDIWGDRTSFLGYDNTCLPFIVLGNIVVMATTYLIHKKFTFQTYFVSIITIVTCFLVQSSNAKIMAFSLMAFYIIWFFRIINTKFFNKVFNYKTYLFISVLLFFGIVVFHWQDYFSDFIVNVLHRNTTFTGRTMIWDRTIEYIKQAPILGYGVADFQERLLTMGIFHAHNTYLNILFEGGIIALVFYFRINLSVIKKIKNYIQDKFVIILSFGTFLYFIMTTIEFYKQSQMFFIILLLLYYSGYLIFEENKKRKEKNE